VDRIGVIGNLDSAGELVPKSYRPRTSAKRRHRPAPQPLRQPVRRVDQRLPEAISLARVERREDLPSSCVEHGEAIALAGAIRHPSRQRVEGADAGEGQPQRRPQPQRRGDADPQAREGARTEADRERLDLAPAPRGVDDPLERGQQRRGMQGALAGR